MTGFEKLFWRFFISLARLVDGVIGIVTFGVIYTNYSELMLKKHEHRKWDIIHNHNNNNGNNGVSGWYNINSGSKRRCKSKQRKKRDI